VDAGEFTLHYIVIIEHGTGPRLSTWEHPVRAPPAAAGKIQEGRRIS
jgi:hypothetical protein